MSVLGRSRASLAGELRIGEAPVRLARPLQRWLVMALAGNGDNAARTMAGDGVVAARDASLSFAARDASTRRLLSCTSSKSA